MQGQQKKVERKVASQKSPETFSAELYAHAPTLGNGQVYATATGCAKLPYTPRYLMADVRNESDREAGTDLAAYGSGSIRRTT